MNETLIYEPLPYYVPLVLWSNEKRKNEDDVVENTAPFIPSCPTLSIFRRIASKVDTLAKNGPE